MSDLETIRAYLSRLEDAVRHIESGQEHLTGICIRNQDIACRRLTTGDIENAMKGKRSDCCGAPVCTMCSVHGKACDLMES